MKAKDILLHFRARAPWIDPEHSVDKIIIGDPDKDVSNALVTWISSFKALRLAVERGFDLLVTHEPTFYRHSNELETMDNTPIGRDKRAFIEQHGLVVLRNHDVWDRFPEVGIPWAWARYLELGQAPAGIGAGGYQHRYDIEPVPVNQLAMRIAAKTAALGEPYVQVVGNGNQVVSRIGAGTGCCCQIPVFREMGCEASIVCDDGTCYWENIQQAEDLGHPVIRVNHGTSEEPGMVTLTQYINDHLPGVKAEHLPHGATFRLVGA